MEAKLILAVWGLLCIALSILGVVWCYARRRGVSPNRLLLAHPHLTMGAMVSWGLLFSCVALAWAWTETGGSEGPGWFFLPLVPFFATGGFLLGLRQAERENKRAHRKEVRSDEVA